MKRFTGILFSLAIIFTLNLTTFANAFNYKAIEGESSNTSINSQVQNLNYNNLSPLSQTSGIINETVYRIKNVGSGKYLNVHYGVDANATNVYQWTGDGSTEQKFKVVYSASTDSYKIYAMCSSGGTNRVLDVVRNGSPLSHGQNVDIWTPIDATAQEMKIINIGNGQYRISMRANQSLYLTAYGNSNGSSGGTTATSAGNVYISNYAGNSNQCWIFESLSQSGTAAAPEGWLDGVSSTEISGWAWRSDIPNTPIDVHVYITNLSTNQQWGYPITANLFRQDLLNAGYGNGYHGYGFSVNWADYPTGNYSIVVYAIGANGNNPALYGCPKNYNYATSDTHKNSLIKGCLWTVPLSGGIIATIGYNVSSTCYVKTYSSTNRITSEISSFAKADKNPNPEINLPTISIGTTNINNTTIKMASSTNVWVSPDWIWGYSVSNQSVTCPAGSNFSSIAICMLNGAINPYQSVTNSFSF